MPKSEPTVDDAVQTLRAVAESDAYPAVVLRALRVLLRRVDPQHGRAGQGQARRAEPRHGIPGDHMHAFYDHWADIVLDEHGRLDLDKVARELADFSHVLAEVPLVYDHVTGGRLSKPNYYAADVTSEADEHYAELHEPELHEPELREIEADEQSFRAMLHGLMPLCPCDLNPETTDGPQQECPLHGDGTTFVAVVRALEAVRRRAGEARDDKTVDAQDSNYALGWRDAARVILGELGRTD